MAKDGNVSVNPMMFLFLFGAWNNLTFFFPFVGRHVAYKSFCWSVGCSVGLSIARSIWPLADYMELLWVL